MQMPDYKIGRTVFGSAEALDKLIALHGHVPSLMSFTVLQAFETVEFGAYRVTALPARHMAELEGAFIYVIEREGKCILYAHDTGYPFDEVLEFIRERGFRFDLVSMDCTCGDLPTSDESKHMGIENNRRLVCRLEEFGAITDETVCVINHFSHNGDPLQQRLEALVAPFGWRVAHDGLDIDF
jgi:phosphoribosyl 1,2-cyclic phosphate phosphodiesterase